jgi:hypothetical protein
MREFANHLTQVRTSELRALNHGLQVITRHIQRVAKAEIGHYQSAVGMFPEWAELADSTKAERVRLGYTENDPGLRSGAMRDSIENQVSGLEGVIGSNDDHLVYFEFGTSKQPARPVLGTAAYRSQKVIEKAAGAALVNGFIGEERIHPSLGYDMDVGGD